MKKSENLLAQKKTENPTRGLFFIAAIMMVGVLLGAAVIAFLPGISEQPQVYKDIIVESLTMLNLNKTGELNLFWCCMVVGGILLLGIDFAFAKASAKRKTMRLATPLSETMLYGLGMLIIPNLAIFLYTGSVNVFFMFLALQYVIVGAYSEKYAMKSVVLAVSINYTIVAAIAGLNLVTVSLKYSQDMIWILAMLASAIICCAVIPRGREHMFDSFVVIFQIPVPCILLAFCIDKYMYKGELLTVPFSSSYYFVMAALIAILCGFAVWKSYKLINAGKTLVAAELILLSTVISIFAFHSYISPGLFFPTDWHHFGEQMIAWQQVFGQHQSLYQDFFPVSGLFPMLIGFLQNIILKGTVTSLPAALSMMAILFAILTITLCYYAGGSIVAFFVALFLRISVYDRPYMILPVILVLILPQVIKKRNLWLQLWVFLCFLSGLYYPSLGGAVLLGALPFGIVQIVMLVKTGELKKLLKKPAFYITWLVFLAPIIASLPMLLGMAKNVMIYASQTVTADGITIFGSTPPADFTPYIPYVSVRLALYYVNQFLIPILAALIFVYCLYLFLRKADLSLTEKLTHPAFLALSSGIIMLIICYTSTQVRMDSGVLLARTASIIMLVGGIFFSVIIWRYGHLIVSRETKIVLLGISLGVSTVLAGLQPDVSSLLPYYTVAKDFEVINTALLEKVPSAGDGFISTSNKEKLLSYYDIFSKNDFRDYPILNLGDQLAYFPLNLKAAATGTTAVAKSKETQDAIIEVLEKDYPLIYDTPTNILRFSFTNYYLYRWMLDNDYQLGPDHLYMPADLIDKYYGKDYKSDPRTYRLMESDIGNMANSLGRSIESLMPRFQPYEAEGLSLMDAHGMISQGNGVYQLTGGKEQDPFFLYSLGDGIYGKDADFLYLKLDSSADVSRPANETFGEKMTKNTRGENYKVKVYWECKEEAMSESLSITCNYGDGKLLIPLGANPGWLLSHNTKMRIDFEDGFAAGMTVSVKKMEFLTLKR